MQAAPSSPIEVTMGPRTRPPGVAVCHPPNGKAGNLLVGEPWADTLHEPADLTHVLLCGPRRRLNLRDVLSFTLQATGLIANSQYHGKDHRVRGNLKIEVGKAVQ